MNTDALLGEASRDARLFTVLGTSSTTYTRQEPEYTERDLAQDNNSLILSTQPNLLHVGINVLHVSGFSILIRKGFLFFKIIISYFNTETISSTST